ncbi:MAG: hypothetical protein IJ501_03735 [Bacilli bacterium]|nr:hypothetical protein [Bacilli bacterium]
MILKLNNDDNLVIQSIAIGVLLMELNDKKFLESDYFLKKYNFEFKDILKKMTLDSQGVVMILLYVFFVVPKEIYADNLQYEKINDFIKNKIDNNVYVLNQDDYKDNDYAGHIRNAVSHANFIFEPQKSLTIFDTNQYNKRKPKNIKTISISIPLKEIVILLEQIYKLVIAYYNHQSQSSN